MCKETGPYTLSRMRALALAVHRREAPLHRAHRLHALLLAVGEAVGEAADRDLIQWLDAHLEAYPPHAVRALIDARPWLRGAWPCNPRLPRPKPTHGEARKVAVTPTELAKRTFAVFERAGAPKAACFSDMLLEHMLARHPVLWSRRVDVVDDEWIASRARRIRQGVLARYSWQLDQFDRRLRRLSPADAEYADAARQRAQTWHAIRERAEEEVDAFTRCELGGAQRAHHARREWAAVRVQRCVSHWLYKPPGGPMFRKGLRSLRGSVLHAPEASAPPLAAR